MKRTCIDAPQGVYTCTFDARIANQDKNPENAMLEF
jgi:hypothetical protein